MRLKNSFLNVITSIFFLVVIGILGFLKIRFFIQYMGSEANGLLQMIYRILSYLSLAQFGFGSAILFKLYKPLAENNHEEVSKIMTTAGYFFKRVGIGVLVFLVIFMFFVPLLIKGDAFDSKTIYFVFLLAGIPYAVEYLWYKKYTIILMSDQKKYMLNIITNLSTVIIDILLIYAMTCKVSLIGYVLIAYPFYLIKGIILQMIYRKRYYYVTKTKKLDKESMSLSKDVFVHNVGSLINNSSDQIVLSFFHGLRFVSIYASYYYVVKYLNDFLSAVLSSVTDSFGNLFSDEKEKSNKSYDVFKEYLSFSSLLSVVISSTFFISVLKFVDLWINDATYILSFSGVIAFTLLIYSTAIMAPLGVAISSNGIFKQTKYYSFIATILNITLSLLLVTKYSIAGIVIATVISKLLVWTPLTIKAIYKNIFINRKTRDYYYYILKSIVLLVLFIIFSRILKISTIYSGGWLNWILGTSIVFVTISIFCFTIFYIFDKSFVKFVKRCKKLIVKKDRGKK